ncbi:tRNA (adenosine(37)-N6)-threonylcarbamoyltransferase complex ATPase subunit type 1 TsaE [Candidatus Dojkabacteria bacterium]|nr:tRNA (adenosine(37)-N6)-threonylcarbamoyltransferase complex ATPase subunit type 1 TsaE [Candidatus Dojkabacteria bacterium]
MIILSFSSIKETEELAGQLASKLDGGEVIFLEGELGAGKTLFVKFLAKHLGVSETVKSPTFVLFQKYEGEKLGIYHFDLYRLEDQLKKKSITMEEIGISEALNDTSGVVVIEWADLLGENGCESKIGSYLQIRFNIKDYQKREVEIIGKGEKYIGLMESLKNKL